MGVLVELDARGGEVCEVGAVSLVEVGAALSVFRVFWRIDSYRREMFGPFGAGERGVREGLGRPNSPDRLEVQRVSFRGLSGV